MSPTIALLLDSAPRAKAGNFAHVRGAQVGELLTRLGVHLHATHFELPLYAGLSGDGRHLGLVRVIRPEVAAKFDVTRPYHLFTYKIKRSKRGVRQVPFGSTTLYASEAAATAALDAFTAAFPGPALIEGLARSNPRARAGSFVLLHGKAAEALAVRERIDSPGIPVAYAQLSGDGQRLITLRRSTVTRRWTSMIYTRSTSWTGGWMWDTKAETFDTEEQAVAYATKALQGQVPKT